MKLGETRLSETKLGESWRNAKLAYHLLELPRLTEYEMLCLQGSLHGKRISGLC